MDDEYEAAEFIEMRFRSTFAFVMNVEEGESEHDCTAVTGSNAMHEFRYVITNSDGAPLINIQVRRCTRASICKKVSVLLRSVFARRLEQLPEQGLRGRIRSQAHAPKRLEASKGKVSRSL